MSAEQDLALLTCELREKAQAFKHAGKVHVAYDLEGLAREAERVLEATTVEEGKQAIAMSHLIIRLSLPRSIQIDES